MSQQMTVTGIQKEDVWGAPGRENQAYSLDLTDAQGNVQIGVTSNRKIKPDGSHNEPKVDDVIWGDIVPDGRGGEKLTLDYEAMKGGSAPRPSGGSTESKTSNNSKGDTDWELRNGEIRRQHSQEMALRFFHQQPAVPTLEEIFALADSFDQDAIAAGQRASQGAAQTGDSPHASSLPAAPDSPPADIEFAGARTEEPGHTSLNFPKGDLPDVDRDHIMRLLSSAGLVFAAAQEKVADYILTQLVVAGREKAALSGLQDHERQGVVLAQLKVETEKWIGSPLPQGDALDGDDIPFHHPEYKEPGYERLRWRF